MQMRKRIMMLITICIVIGGMITTYYFNKSDENDCVKDEQSIGSELSSDDDEMNTLEEESKDKEKAIEDKETKAINTRKKIKLPVEEIVQENEYFCVPACVQMVLRYKGIHISQTELGKQMHTIPVSGTEYADMTKILNTYLFHNPNSSEQEAGYHIQTLAIDDHDAQIAITFEERVKQDMSTQDPVFVAVDIHDLYPSLPHGNHMIIVIGYESDENNHIQTYYYIDPSYVVRDTIYGNLKMIANEDLIYAIVSNEEPAYIW